MGFLDSGAGDAYDLLTPDQQAIIDAAGDIPPCTHEEED